jgi:DNA-binding XRE family transcriptional regulator
MRVRGNPLLTYFEHMCSITSTRQGRLGANWIIFMITAAQVRMARGALGWSTQDLADKAKVSVSTIRRYESERGGMLATTLDHVQSTLEKNGIVFLAPGDVRDGGYGVRFKKK